MAIGIRLSDLLPPDDEPDLTGAYVDEPSNWQDAYYDTGVDETNAYNRDRLPCCDMCQAAYLAESGRIATKLTPDQLHGQCREPGTCSCGCPWSRGATCVNCGRVRIEEQLTIAMSGSLSGRQCSDTEDCGAAMLRQAALVKPKRR